MCTFLDCRINDDFYRKLLAMQRQRAQSRFAIGTVLLFFTVGMIFVGIMIFKDADPLKNISTEGESAYIAELQDLRGRQRKLSIESQRPTEIHTVAKRTDELASKLNTLPTRWEQLLSFKTRPFLVDLRRSGAFARDVSEAFA